MTTSVSSSGDIFDGILEDTRWSTSGETTLTYSFPDETSHYELGLFKNYGSNELDSGFAQLTTSQQQVAATALSSVSSFTKNLNFKEITETDSTHADLRLAQTDNTDPAHAYTPASRDPERGDSWYENKSGFQTPQLGEFFYATIMHEIGHALGLKHGHDSDSPYGALPSDRDSEEFSVMTYKDYVGDAADDSENEYGGGPQSYMMLDIAALQYMYGADYSSSSEIWSGNTTYTFDPTTGEMSINGVGQGTPAANRIYRTIWDGDGEDTYDLSNYTTDLDIDLRPGRFSTFSQTQVAQLDGKESTVDEKARGNLANALLHEGDTRSLIENAVGGLGDDTLFGNQADNTLTGGAGDNRLRGASGDDTFRYTGGQDAGADEYVDGDTGHDDIEINSNTDTTFDFSGKTLFDLEELTFGADGAVDKTLQISSRIVEDSAKLGESFELDGNDSRGAKDVLEILMQTSTLDLSSVTLTDWGGQDDTVRIDGTSSAETITGTSGIDDIRVGGLGGDTVDARGGNDIVDAHGLDNDADVRLDGGAGYDTLVYSSVFSNATIDLAAETATAANGVSEPIIGFERVRDSQGGNTIIGSNAANVIKGRDGADTIRAGKNKDVVYAGAGSDTVMFENDAAENDVYFGGTGSDTIDGDGLYFLFAEFNLRTGFFNGLTYQERLVGFENYRNPSGQGTDKVIGNDEPNVLVTGSGPNVLKGGAAADTLEAGGGADELQGGPGGDTLSGGPGRDTAIYADSSASVLVDLARDNYSDGAAAGDRLSGIEHLEGSDHGDRLFANDARNVLEGAGGGDNLIGRGSNDRLEGGTGEDRLDGDGGDDRLIGGADGDRLIGGPGQDTLSYASSPAGVSIDLDDETASGGHAEGDKIAPTVETDLLGSFTYAPAENLIGSDHADTLDGDERANTIHGGSDGDDLRGVAGEDRLFGEQGKDRLFGGAEADLLRGGPGADWFLAGGGRDTLSYVDSNAAVTIDLADGTADGGTASGDTIAPSLSLPTGGSIDYEPAENIDGTGYADTLRGDDRANTLRGHDADDTVRGRGGRDNLVYDDGTDTFSGGSGRDTVDFSNFGSAVWVHLDALYIEGYTRGEKDLESGSWTSIAYIDGVERIVGTEYDDELGGNAGDDQLVGGPGDDTLVYAGGRDTLRGGKGGDTADFSESKSAVWVHLDYYGSTEAQTKGTEDLDASGTWRGIADIGDGVENVVGSRYGDELSGDGGRNRLEGKAGDDHMIFAGGRSVFQGGADRDTVDFSDFGSAVWAHLASSGFVDVYTRDSDDLSSGSWRDLATVTGSERIVGTAYDDSLKGNSADNVLNAGKGDDTLLYVDGHDTMKAGAGRDTVDFSDFGSAVWVHLDYYGSDEAQTKGAKDFSSGSWEPIASIENAEQVVGTEYDDELRGDSGDNLLRGGQGDDTLVYGDGFDRLEGGSGTDTADFSSYGSAVWVHLDYYGKEEAQTRGTDDLNSGTWDKIASADGIENVVGSGSADDLRGDSGTNRLNGRAGEDTLQAGPGSDQLFGGEGPDVFAFESGIGTATVRDWQDDTDTLDLRAFGFSDFNAVESATSEQGGNLLIDTGGGDTVKVLNTQLADFDSGDVWF